MKRRPAVVLSSPVYHECRPDMVVGLIASRAVESSPTDYPIEDWSMAGLRVPSIFRCFLATLPRASRPVVAGHLSERDWEGVRTCVKAALTPLL